MPYAPPRGKIVSIVIIPTQDEVDALLDYLRKHKNGCHGRDLPPQFQDVTLLEFCKREGLISATPRRKR